MVLPSAPEKGAGIPHSTSRVTARGFKPSFIQFKLKLLTLLGSCWLPCRYFVRDSASFERSMYQCRVVLTVGLFLQITQYGSTKAVGSSSLPHISHWSPRAFSQPQYGHFPSTKRSGRNRWSCSQYNI